MMREWERGRVSWGIGWWNGSAKIFMCERTYYDGYYYGFRIGPFWLSVQP